jgi:hypothetical protein
VSGQPTGWAGNETRGLLFFLPDCPFSSSREASELLLPPPRELPVP